MNQRDYLYIEGRLYSDHAALDAIARLREVGEAELAADLLAIEMRHGDELRAMRARLRERASAAAS